MMVGFIMVGVRKSIGLVLLDERQRRYVITILDVTVGKIQAVVSRCRYTASLIGMLVEYELIEDARGYRLQALEPVAQLHYVSYEHHQLFHQLLDIIKHVLPSEASAEEIFMLVHEYIHHARSGAVYDERIIKLMMCSILYAAGFYESTNTVVDELIQLPFECLHTRAHEVVAGELDAMIITSLQRYPHAQQLKTIHFFKGAS
jgi:hypothetical protein